MQRLRTVHLLDVSAVAGHHAIPAALLFLTVIGFPWQCIAVQMVLAQIRLLCKELSDQGLHNLLF